MIRKVIWVVPICVLFSGQLFSQDLYRYMDEQGVTILNSSIPAAYVNAGYEVINSHGHVIQVVPPKAEVADELVVEKSDTILMTSFSDIIEIEERRDRVIENIEREMDNIESDRRVLGLQIAEQLAERDRLLRLKENRGLSEVQTEQLTKLETRIESMKEISLKLQINFQQRASDIVAIQNEYALKVERFVQLEQSEVDVRQTLVNAE